MKQLSLEDRYYLSMYSRRLPCTLRLRLAIDAFLEQIELTPEEIKEHNIEINPSKMEFTSDSNIDVEYEEFHPDVIIAMKNYITIFDSEGNAENT